MIIKDINKKIQNAPDNINEEFTTIKSKIESVNTELDNIKNELNKSENTSYQTINGVKEFTCKEGYADNIYIEGKTLVNLVDEKRSVSEPDFSRMYLFPTYDVSISTAFNINGKAKIYVSIHNKTDKVWIRDVIVEPNTSVKISLSDVEYIHVYKARVSDGWLKTDLELIKKSLVVLSGDHTDKKISYFKGLKSIGQGDKIEVLTTGTNIFNKNDFVVGGTSSETGTKFEIDTKQNRITHTNPIQVDVYEHMEFVYNVDLFKTLIYELDENKTILTTYSWSKYRGIRTLTSNTKFIQVVFAYDDDRDMTLEDIKEIKPTLTRQYDKKIISTTLRALPNGVKDTIEKHGDMYYNVQRCREVVLGENEIITGMFNVGDSTTIGQFNIDFSKYLSNIKSYDLHCDKFKNILDQNYEGESIFLNYIDKSKEIIIRIDKTKLTTQDIAGFKAWLKDNPITLIYELEEPIITEIPNINPRIFTSKTTLMLNTGVIESDCKFEVINSVRREIDILKDKISSLESIIQLVTQIKNRDKVINGEEKRS